MLLLLPLLLPPPLSLKRMASPYKWRLALTVIHQLPPSLSHHDAANAAGGWPAVRHWGSSWLTAAAITALRLHLQCICFPQCPFSAKAHANDQDRERKRERERQTDRQTVREREVERLCGSVGIYIERARECM